jgi:hypothetical protein
MSVRRLDYAVALETITGIAEPARRSMAETLIPVKLMLKATMIWGTCRGWGAIPDTSNTPSFLLRAAAYDRPEAGLS